jgi:hypothetical protein
MRSLKNFRHNLSVWPWAHSPPGPANLPNYFNRTEMKNTVDADFDSTVMSNLSDAQNRLVMELLQLATGKKIPIGGKESVAAVAEQFGVSIRTVQCICKRYWYEKLISNSSSPVLAASLMRSRFKILLKSLKDKAKRMRHTNSIFENR